MGRHYIAGQWETGSGEEVLEITSPSTGAALGAIALGTQDDARRAVDAANASRSALAGMSIWERSALCMAIAERIEARADELAEIICAEQGKPIGEARGEAGGAAVAFRNAGEQIKWLESASFPVEDGAKRAMSMLQPKGTLGIITPWNFPVALPSIYYLGPAIATGNAFVWVPAPTTSLCAVKLMECIIEAGVPEGCANLVLGEGPVVGDALVTHAQVHGICFTGSSEVGEIIARRGAGKAQLLELGGNGPSIVFADADIERAAERIVAGAVGNAGQICTATERVLAHADIHDALVDRIVAHARKVAPSLSTEAGCVLGALNNADNAAKVDSHLAEAVAGGARILTGGGRAKGLPTDLYYAPTVIVDVPPQSALHCEETFGPVVPVLKFSSVEELDRLCAMSPMGLSAAVFTRDVGNAFRQAEKLRCGIVNINEMSSYWEMHIPAGGAAGTTSGHGRTGGRHTLREMSDLKTITFHIGD
ncbi:aldehyde dehydrogenase family protein [Pelagibacterium montanilacus]|uniref:aldehyde dehydrogenase family protein n=1 Tax=Pelagibacterium montanilacus TaxID=2185280 RepID=UPI001FE76782|nr:aldehyde dehydrogenase family protein [Pelagibacterium montanilacus]